MITVRTGAYTKDDLIFLATVIGEGMAHNCYNIAYKGNEVCDNCKNKIACNELYSAKLYAMSVFYRNGANSGSEK